MQLKYVKVRDVKSPKRANSTDAGIDFFVPEDIQTRVIFPSESILIPSGIKVDVPSGWALIFKNKSGVATKKGLIVGAEVVDHGYSGEVHIHLINTGKEKVNIQPGEKIIQGVMLEVGLHEPVEVSVDEMWNDVQSDRGEGGFGSTGTK